MSQEIIYDNVIGEIKKEDDQWRARWQWSQNQTVNITVSFEDEEPELLPAEVRQFLIQLKNKDGEIRSRIAAELLDSCNDDWNPGANITQEDFANRISCSGLHTETLRLAHSALSGSLYLITGSLYLITAHFI